MRAIIVGAGIGGLCAALALRRAGFDVQVFERAAQLSDVGAGISHQIAACLHATHQLNRE